jgi:hypothetical protein
MIKRAAARVFFSSGEINWFIYRERAKESV